MIFVSMAAIGVLRNISLQQAKAVEYDYTVTVVEQLKEVIDKANAYPDNAEYLIKLKDPIIYQANISNNKISFYFPKTDTKKDIYFFSPEISVVPSSFETSGIIHVYKKDNNLYITNQLLCNTTDDKCDAGCIALGLCDPACYRKNTHDVCNPYCLDTNKNGKIDQHDSDNICDPDCYTTYKKGFYDIDCVDEEDGICDPDTNNIADGICDRDCLGTNGVCDPDCTEFDADCPHQGNGICEPIRGESCLNEIVDCNCSINNKICKADCGPFIADTKTDEWGCVEKTDISKKGKECRDDCQCDANLICDTKFGTMHCCPENEYFDTKSNSCVNYKLDGKCNVEGPYFENCDNSPTDCKCSVLGLGECCPNCLNAKPEGCCDKGTIKCNGKCKKIETPLKEKEKCECDGECGSDANNNKMKCSANSENANDKACCPEEEDWNGTECEFMDVWNVVFVALNFKDDETDKFRAAANFALNDFMAKSPFKECSDPMSRVKVYYVDPRDCKITCSDLCIECNYAAITCVKNSPYSNIWDKIIGIYGEAANLGIMGCAAGIPGDSSVSRVNMPQVVVHEAGHSLGLCHINCAPGGRLPGGACLSWCPNKNDCSPPQLASDVESFIMDYCDGFYRYGPNAYNYLKTVSLKKWLKNC